MLRPLRVSQPTSVTEASAELSRLGDDAKVYAGGTELILLLRLGLVQYTHLVDIKRIPELGELAWDGKRLHIGGAVTHRQLERSAEVAEYLPLLQQELELHIEGATLAEGQQIVRQAQRHYEEVLQPVDDLHGSVAYKTYLTGVLLGRALAQAVGANGRN
jgi:CO/xanthine dehydrogenase FAD-binding subunit